MLTPSTPLSSRVVEGLTNIFWLATWASLASYASALNVANAGYYFVLAGRQLGIASGAPPPPPGPDGGFGPDGGRGPGGNGGRPGGAGSSSAGQASAAAAARSSIQAARIAIAVDAGLGAVIWVLFVITLIATSKLAAPPSFYTHFTSPYHSSLAALGSTDTGFRKRHVYYKSPEKQQVGIQGERPAGSGGMIRGGGLNSMFDLVGRFPSRSCRTAARCFSILGSRIFSIQGEHGYGRRFFLFFFSEIN